MSTIKTKKSGRGRPRSPETREKILKAAYEMLNEVGFIDLTIEGVAKRAEVGNPTIYRRWKTKAAKIVKFMNSSRGEVLASVIGCGQADEELMAAFRDRWLTHRREDASRCFISQAE